MCAIARATRVPSGELRERLREAQLQGQLGTLPAADWSPGFPRDQRALQLSHMAVEDKNKLALAVQQTFRLTRAQARLLLVLVQKGELSKAGGDMTDKTIDVHICGMRRSLQPFGIKITTLWGHGYRLSAEHRRKALDLILRSG